MSNEADGGMVGLHHVGFLVKAIDQAADHYVKLLGYQRESEVITDPMQTARVLFLRHPTGTSWLELISPAGEDSKLALAMKKGGGWHHVCYEVSALENAMDHYRACGCFVVSEPAPAVAFPGRRIAWLMDANRMLFELVESGEGRFSLPAVLKNS